MNHKSIDTRLIGIIIIAILGILLFLKFTGNDSIFSYQGISYTTKGFLTYQSGIELINDYLYKQTSNINTIKKGKTMLEDAFLQIKDKRLIKLLSGEMLKVNSLEFYGETKKCVDLLIEGYILLQSIDSQYDDLSSGISNTQKLMKSRILGLPDSETKKCLTSYLGNIQESIGSLAITYKNIQSLQSDYSVSLMQYRQGGGGLCPGTEDFMGSLKKLSFSLSGLIETNMLVQSKLKTNEIKEYNKLCVYGTIQGLTGIQFQSRNAKTLFTAFQVSLNPTNDIVTYIKDLIKSSTGSVVNNNAGKR